MGATMLVPVYRLRIDRAPACSEDRTVRDAGGAARILRALIPDDDGREHFCVAYLNVRHKVTGVAEVSVGCLTSSLVHPREVFRGAIAAGAAAIVVAHNHPSGDPEPSAEDVALTKRLAAAGSLIGIELLDHVVLADGPALAYVSLRNRGAI